MDDIYCKRVYILLYGEYLVVYRGNWKLDI